MQFICQSDVHTFRYYSNSRIFFQNHPGSNSINIKIKWCVIRGIVPPKMKMIYSPSSSKPVWTSLFCRTQRKILWRKIVSRLFWGTIDFHSRKKKYYGSQCCLRTALFSTFFRISSFVFSRTKTFTQVWNYWVSKSFSFLGDTQRSDADVVG